MRKPKLTKASSTFPTKQIIVIIIAITIALVVGSFVWSYYQNTQKVTTTYYNTKPRVNINPFYAAEVLLNLQHDSAQGDTSDTQSEESSTQEDAFAKTLLDINFKMLLEELPPLSDAQTNDAPSKRPTLIINSIGSQLTDIRFDILRQWVEEGGHLITYTKSIVDSKAHEEILDYVEMLKANGVSSDDILADSTVQSMLDDMNTDNGFLAKLGIYVVAEDKSSDEIPTVREKLEILNKELERLHSNQKTATQIRTLERMIRDQSLSVLFAESNPSNRSSDAYNLSSEDLLLINTNNYDNSLNDEVFSALYTDKLKPTFNTKIQSTVDQSLLIRTYLKSQQRYLLPLLDDIKADKQNGTAHPPMSAAANEQERILQLNATIETLLNMQDDVLIMLFKPAQEVYLDHQFGRGRISVIIDNDTFVNPNPNLELPKLTVNETTGERVNIDESVEDNILAPPITAEEILNINNRVSLYDADNAAWLTRLTQNSEFVWMLPNTDIEALPVMLWKQAKFAVLGFLLLIFIWLWSLYDRFGKMQTLSQSHVHDILYYFRQVGRYGWQRDSARKLYQVTHDRVVTMVREALRYYQPPDELELEVNSHNQSSQSDESNNENSLTPSDNINLNNSAQVKILHALLLDRLRERRDLKDGKEATDFAKQNYSTIRTLILPSRLRKALSSNTIDARFADDIAAAEFTQNSQTLWIIAWLLEK